MAEVIIRNSIRCTHCGVEVESLSVNDFRSHKCAVMLSIRGPEACIAADGGREYARRLGDSMDRQDISTTDPPIDPIADAAIRQQRIRAIEADEGSH